MPVTLKVILSDKTKQDGTTPVLLRITVNRITRKVSLGIFIIAKDFNPLGVYHKMNWIRTRNKDHEFLNKKIRAQVKGLQKRIAKAEKNEVVITADIAKGLMAGKKEVDLSFTGYYTRIAERYNTPEQRRTWEKYHFTLAKLHKYNGSEDVMFSNLTVDYIEGFQVWLMTVYQNPKIKVTTKAPNKLNTASKTLAFIRTIIKQAVKDKVMKYEDNPFLHISLKTERANKTKLSVDEIQAFVDLDIPVASGLAWHARNVFMMQYYLAGSRIGDMLQLKWSNVSSDRIAFNMEKTGSSQNIKLHRKAQEILALYEAGKSDNGFVFPFLSNEEDYTNIQKLEDTLESRTSYINKLLKKWFKVAGVTKNVSTHVARHSFTNIARKAGASLYDISKSLRHSSLKVTESYLENFDEKAVDNVIDSVFDDLK